MDEQIWYFTYGSNMDPNNFEKYIGKWKNRKVLCLEGYKLCFNKKSQGVLFDGSNIVPEENNRVYGIGYLIQKRQLDKIDITEGYISFHRYRLNVNCQDFASKTDYLKISTDHNCIVYIASLQYIDDTLKPSIKYLEYLSHDKHLMPRKYIEDLISYIRLIGDYEIS